MGKRIVGIALLLLALFFLFGSLRVRPGGGLVMLITFLITVVAPAAGGIYLLWSTSLRRAEEDATLQRRKDQLRRQTLDAELLKLAKRLGGKLTVVEAVSELAIDAVTIDEALQRMVATGMAEVEISESGVLVYAFYDIQHLGEKDTAKGVLDA